MKGNARLRSSLRLSINASPYHLQVQPFNAPDSASPHSPSFFAGSSKTSPGSQGYRICYALCLHDYFSDDPTHLSFNRNEILEIIAQEETGWWAAMRPGEDKVGWISSAFVEPLVDSVAERLLGVPVSSRSYEYEIIFAPTLASARSLEAYDLASPASQLSFTKRDSWLPAIGKKPPPLSLPTVVEPYGESNDPDGEGQLIDSASSYTSATLWPSPDSSPKVPPSPATLLPVPIVRTMFGSVNSPIPVSPRPFSVLVNNDSPVDVHHHRSRSETLPATLGSRHLRRRPMLLDDRSHLSRLSTLIESNDLTEIDNFSKSPVVTESFDAFHRVALRSPALRTGRVKTPIRETMQPLPSATFPSGSGQAGKKTRTAPTWFLRPTYDDDDINLDYDGTVKAGTLPALVERLTLDYLKPPHEIKFRHAFLTTFRSFTTADMVFDQLVGRFKMAPPVYLSEDEFGEWKEKKQRSTQQRVLTLFTVWLEDHNLIKEDPHIVPRLQGFLQSIVDPHPLAIPAILIIGAIERLSHVPLAPLTPLTPAHTPKRRKQPKFPTTELVKMDTQEVAQQLTLIEHRLYAKIRVQECWEWGRAGGPLHDFMSTHDKLASWVKMSILNLRHVAKRAEMVDFWITCAEKCRVINNISSMHAIINAVSSHVISRLDQTWAHVTQAAVLDSILTFSNPANRFVTYRAAIRACQGPCVPYIGMWLTEIAQINDSYPDTVPSNNRDLATSSLINFSKRAKWFDILEQMLRFQNKPYMFMEVPHTMGYIEGNLVNAMGLSPEFLQAKSREIAHQEMV
ncbi:ras GEF [Thelephora ganbajun]|uniref:Ras GEF n=1 Tax=Thelephora ganbajun TaxID=370292 RepID=A0ACB6ZXA4_THEGA|nr:ras GEF [Thelephora ganbajun]